MRVQWMAGVAPVVLLLMSAEACGGNPSAAAGTAGPPGAGADAGSVASTTDAGASDSGGVHVLDAGTVAPGDGGGGTHIDAATPGDAGAHPGSDASTTPDAAADSGSPPKSDGGGLFANCSLDGGCIADCSPPANDPLATGNPSYDLYDGCFLAAMELAGITQPWQGQLLKAQAYDESGITPSISTSTATCGGQNCGIWAISAGASSGDSAPGPCGSSASDPFTGQVDYSHSYGLFQSTPACEGTFQHTSLPAGYKCTPTTTADVIPFDAGITFYCESATSATGGYIDAVQDPTNPLYATSVFNPAYQLYVYLNYSWAINFRDANAQAKGCTEAQQWYLGLAYWLTGNATTTCTLTGSGLQYVQTAINTYQTVLYNKTWPYPAP